ncbi:MAG TPA: signal recognition particle-docking protein FtsY [Gammaproteobacteria bacterium]|jgi:fused signal recognition particle receptor|nr:signal recognition particle-docking protein FtsY [Gammaproteobacteria bacterium]
MAVDAKEKERTGFFAKLKARLNRGKAWLANDLLGLGSRPLDETTVEELETRLLTGDVGVDATQWLLDEMRKANRRKPGTPASELLRETATTLMRTVEAPLAISAAHKPFVILAVGVNGTGKTTTVGKLAYRLKSSGMSVMLAAADTFRAAAVEQLQEWGRRADVPVIAQAPGADPAAVVHDALVAARARNVDVVLADTAGRLHTAAGLMDELEKVRRVIARFDATAPHETLLVLDASQGQNALAQALRFHERLKVTGLVLTKLDGTAKGGILLAIARALGVPIRFVAVGEGVDDLDEFRAEEFVRALVGERAG